MSLNHSRRWSSAVAVLVLLCLAICSSCAPAGEQGGAGAGDVQDFPVLTGEYLGQTPPGQRAELFAPGIVSRGMHTRDVAMTPDGREIYFGTIVAGLAVIMQTKLEDGQWTRPEVAPFAANPAYQDLEPAISPDGEHFYFLSTRPPAGTEPDPADFGSWVNQDIWVMDREGDGWGEPYNLGPPINSDAPEFYPSVTLDGTIYFTREVAETRASDIWRARPAADGDGYEEAEKLGPRVNSTSAQYNAFIAPDESYLIVCTAGREDTRGGSDYYVVFRDADDNWSEPINLGDEINTPGGEWSPYVSRDGRFFFFMSTRPVEQDSLPAQLTFDVMTEIHNRSPNADAAIYWIDASVIEDLRPGSD
jgi:hypothetical protein